MNDPLIARFAEACGAANPLNLRVGLTDGGVLAEGSVQQPFTLIGRDEACDVTLSDQDVNPRHAWFQVVGGRVYALDLGSRTGLVWPDDKKRSGWLDVDTPVRIGPFQLQLRSPVSSISGQPGPEPLAADPNLSRTRPMVQLDFRNGKRAKDRWTVNRAMTLVGRAEACKLHLQADDISMYHCGLVLTPTGLWVVDLSGRGVVVNGERMRVSPLIHGAELWVGRFLIGCHYPELGDTPSVGRASVLSGTLVPGKGPNGSRSAARLSPVNGMPARPENLNPAIADDEVALGGTPTIDPVSGLPSSHIMCDAFQLPSPSGAHSAVIYVAGSSPTLQQVPTQNDARHVPSVEPPVRPAIPPIPIPLADGAVEPLLRQLSELHGQLFEQFQQSLVLMTKLFGRIPNADSNVLQQELTRIQELNAVLAKLQTEVIRRSLSQIAETHRPSSSDPTPLPDSIPMSSRVRTVNTSEAIQEWVEQRIGALQKERSHRWEKLRGLVAADGSHDHDSLR